MNPLLMMLIQMLTQGQQQQPQMQQPSMPPQMPGMPEMMQPPQTEMPFPAMGMRANDPTADPANMAMMAKAFLNGRNP